LNLYPERPELLNRLQLSGAKTAINARKNVRCRFLIQNEGGQPLTALTSALFVFHDTPTESGAPCGLMTVKLSKYFRSAYTSILNKIHHFITVRGPQKE
jgi:hypothetical protein